MDEILAQTRRTLKFIGQLDNEAHECNDQLDEILKEYYDNPDDKQRGMQVTRLLDKIHFLRVNCLSEATYLLEYIDDTHNAKTKELERMQRSIQSGEQLNEEILAGGAEASRASAAADADGGTAEEDNELYCTCRRGFFGEMVACDNPKCPIEWYHLACVGLRYAPKGDWYCPRCKRK